MSDSNHNSLADLLRGAISAWPQFDPTSPRYDEEVNGGDAVEFLGGFLDDARKAIASLPAPAPLVIWTCTTEGDNCPLTTTVHATEAEALERVRDDLRTDCRPAQLAHLEAMPTAELPDAWGNANDGACIIESHEVQFTPSAAPSEIERLRKRDEELKLLETPPATKLERVRLAARLIRTARQHLRDAGANNAADYVQRALKSVQGAERHALRMNGEAMQATKLAGPDPYEIAARAAGWTFDEPANEYRLNDHGEGYDAIDANKTWKELCESHAIPAAG